MKLYAAYGMNTNKYFMPPDLLGRGGGEIIDYRLAFNRHATIIPESGSTVPCVVWEMDEKLEKGLDYRETYPTYYRKENVNVKLSDGIILTAVAYVMNDTGKLLAPETSYLDLIKEGYKQHGIKTDKLSSIANNQRGIDTSNSNGGAK